LRADELHEKAIKAAGGYDDFGDTGYREAFGILMGSIDEEAHLHPIGRWLFEYQIVGMLTSRLLANKRWEEHPEDLEVAIDRPMVITGMVRTGSTALHYLMGANPDTQALPYWIATHPQPRPPREAGGRRLDLYKAKAELAMMYGLGEGLEAIHHITAEGPEECRHLLAQNFTDDCYEVAAHVPSYAAWYAKGHHLESYQRHKKLIQTISSTEPHKRWLLKYPVHIRH
ncbi:MAG: sulfotransferase, partial [Actinomycetia bacterium]|nr:sulfotransferase [Actinomycetes bacterium]